MARVRISNDFYRCATGGKRGFTPHAVAKVLVLILVVHFVRAIKVEGYLNELCDLSVLFTLTQLSELNTFVFSVYIYFVKSMLIVCFA